MGIGRGARPPGTVGSPEAFSSRACENISFVSLTNVPNLGQHPNVLVLYRHVVVLDNDTLRETLFAWDQDTRIITCRSPLFLAMAIRKPRGVAGRQRKDTYERLIREDCFPFRVSGGENHDERNGCRALLTYTVYGRAA